MTDAEFDSMEKEFTSHFDEVCGAGFRETNVGAALFEIAFGYLCEGKCIQIIPSNPPTLLICWQRKPKKK